MRAGGAWGFVGAPRPGASVEEVAASQFGVASRGQCLAAGTTDAVLRWRVASGRWRRIHPGVFLTHSGDLDWNASAAAAVLWASTRGTGADVGLAGDAAGFVQGLTRRPPAVVEVVVPAGRRVEAAPGLRVRRTRHDLDRLLDPVLYPWRTIVPVTAVDLAADTTADGALAVLARAVQRNLTSADRLAAELAGRRGHPHGALLREALADVADGAHSAAEVRYVRDVERAHGLPRATRQSTAGSGGRSVHDNEYEEYGVLVEVDGRLGHETWQDRVRDGRRDRSATRRGRLTVRVFWPDVAVTPCATAVDVGAALGSAGWTGTLRPCRRRGCVVRTTR